MDYSIKLRREMFAVGAAIANTEELGQGCNCAQSPAANLVLTDTQVSQKQSNFMRKIKRRSIRNLTQINFRIAAIMFVTTTIVASCDKNEENTNNAAGTPSAVQNFSATAGDGQVVLTWNEPAENGGEEITGYEVTADNWANKVTKTAPEQTHTYTGLTNGTEYTFKVRAVNANGAGAESTAKATPMAGSGSFGTWTDVPNTIFGTQGTINSIAYGNGKFVAVGANNDGEEFKMAYSTDAINWTAVENTGLTAQYFLGTIPRANTVNAVAYGNGKFVAVTENNEISYSTDGVNWTASGASGFIPTILYGIDHTSIKSIVYGNGKFVIGGFTGGQPSGNPEWICGAQMSYSTDGISWTSIDPTAFGFNLGLAIENVYKRVDRLYFENGLFFAGQAGNPKMAYSPDGVNWTALPNMPYAYALAYGNNKFIASPGIDFKIGTSVDGLNWTEINSNQSRLSQIIFVNGKFVATEFSGGTVFTSADGISWNRTTVYNSGIYVLKDIAYGGGKYVVVGYQKDYTHSLPKIAYCNE
jgi:hypothetical protein